MPHVGVQVCQRGVLAHAMSAMDLDGLVNDFKAHAGRIDLRHGDVRLRRLEAMVVRLDCREVAQQPGLGDLHARLGDSLPNGGLVCKELPKGRAVMRTVNDGIEGLLRSTNGAHAVVNAARTQAALRDFEATSLPEDHVAHRHTDVVEHDLRVVVDVAEESKWPHDGHTLCVAGDEDHGVAVVERATTGHGASQEDKYLALWPAGTADVPLVPVDDVLVPIAHDGRADVGGIAACNPRLGHGVRAANGAFQERLQPPLLLLGGAISLQDLHVASVGRRAVHRHVAQAEGAEDLTDGRVFQDAELPHLRQEKVVEAAGLGPLSQLHRDWR
mmetsp:Transcript_96916/g.269614  ORF Transcript_96916/g.269614 Transcript_96916/m.269614 type:complete len:329 (-) Transcript_96916:362-1348(-)